MFNKKEVARDLLALGSIPFYAIVLARSLIGQHLPFIYQLLISGLVLMLLAHLGKAQLHLARGFILILFTSMFYQDIVFTAFLAIIYAAMIWAAAVNEKIETVVGGLVLGLLSAVAGYYLPKIITLML